MELVCWLNGSLVRWLAVELVMAKMEEEAVLDVVAMRRSLVVSIFGDMRGGDDGT